MTSALALLAYLSVNFGIVAIATIWRGYVLSVIWGWLVVPMFALPPITVLGAIIISMIVGFLTYQHSTAPKDPEKTGWGHMLGIAFGYPAVVLFIAWIVKFSL
jgi:hypothetical protein